MQVDLSEVDREYPFDAFSQSLFRVLEQKKTINLLTSLTIRTFSMEPADYQVPEKLKIENGSHASLWQSGIHCLVSC